MDLAREKQCQSGAAMPDKQLADDGLVALDVILRGLVVESQDGGAWKRQRRFSLQSLVHVRLHGHFDRPLCAVSRNPYGNSAQVAASILSHGELFELSHLLGGFGDETISLTNTQGSASIGSKPIVPGNAIALRTRGGVSVASRTAPSAASRSCHLAIMYICAHLHLVCR
jgi:hypothetical protein